MSMAVTFDTLKYVERLEHAGVPSNQARVQVEALSDVMAEEAQRISDQFVTKATFSQDTSGLSHEVNALRLDLKQEISTLRLETKSEIKALRLETKADIADAKSDLVRWVVGVGILQMALIAGLILKLLH